MLTKKLSDWLETKARYGRWITLNGGSGDNEDGGTHVFIDDDGNIEAGPKSLEGRNIKSLNKKPDNTTQQAAKTPAKGGNKGDSEPAKEPEPSKPAIKKQSQIKLQVDEGYHPRFAPKNAKKAYIAKINGRDSGPFKYDREFKGKSAEILDGDDGLYEMRNVDKKGRPESVYHVFLSHPDYGVIQSYDVEEILPQIASRLDRGMSIQDIVDIGEIEPNPGGFESEYVFEARLK